MKKIWFIMLTVAMLVLSVGAQEIKISAEVVERTVIAEVCFEDNPGVAGFSINMNFDKSLLEPISVESGEALNGASVTSNLHIEKDLSKLDYVSAVWISTQNNRNDGVFYKVIFKIKDGANGKTNLTLSYDENNISDSSLQKVDFDLTSAVINLDKGTTGGGNTTTGGTAVVPPSNPNNESASKKIYADVNENDWYFADVAFVYEKGLMTGTATEPELLFSPLLHTNRAMFVTVLYRMEGQPRASQSSFTDIEKGAYYEKAVSWAAQNGIVSGISPTEFAPLSPITREQTAKIIANYAAYKKIKLPPKTADITSFNDYNSINSWALDALQACADMNIIRGRSDNTIDPQGKTTRAETAAILRRFVEYSGK